MFSRPITILLIALTAGILGFGGATAAAIGIAKMLFSVSLMLLLIASLIGRKTTIR